MMLAIASRRAAILGGGSVPVPLQVAGLIAWYEFFDLSTLFTNSTRTTPAVNDGDPLGGVTDKGGQGNHLSQGTTANKPTLKLAIQNGKSVARFDGVNDALSKAFTLGTPHTRFVAILNRSAQNGSAVLIDGAGGSNTGAMDFRATDSAEIWCGSSVNTAAVGTTWHIWSAVFNGASSSLQIDGGAAVTGNPGTRTAGGIVLAQGGAGGNNANCDIAAVLEYDSVLSAGAIAAIIGYLNSTLAIY